MASKDCLSLDAIISARRFQTGDNPFGNWIMYPFPSLCIDANRYRVQLIAREIARRF